MRISVKAIRTGHVARTARIAAALAVAATAAGAQAPVHRFAVTTRLGGLTFERAASLQTTPVLGLDSEYGLSKYFAIGTSINVARPNTRASDFLTSISYGVPITGDTIFYYQTGQAANLLEGALFATARVTKGRLVPFASAGAGYYSFFLDPQVNRGRRREANVSGLLAAGAAYRLSSRAGISFNVRDMILTGYHASAFDPSGGRNQNVNFVEDFPRSPSRKSTISGLIYTIGFRYVPLGADDRGEEDRK
jgi:hypothetical protein